MNYVNNSDEAQKDDECECTVDNIAITLQAKKSFLKAPNVRWKIGCAPSKRMAVQVLLFEQKQSSIILQI